MTKEQIERCNEFAQNFRWAIRSNFVHMTNGEFSKVANIYKDVFGETLTQSQMTCNTCRLKALKRLGEVYEAELQRIAEEQKEERIENADNQEVKKKGGRKKKIDID